MQTLEQVLIPFFEQAAKRDKTLLRELERDPCFTLMPDRWCFTLPDLFSFLQPRSEAIGKVSYKEFRRAIYTTSINAATRHYGAEVVIDRNHGQVDKSVYALTWRNREDGTST
jgi:hypothetical protein